MPRQLHSYHIFMFPFSWTLWQEHPANKKAKPLDEKTRFELMTERLKKGHWSEDEEFCIDTGEAYNEYNYFYPHVREILYDQHANLRIHSSEENQFLIKHFKYKNPAGDLKYLVVHDSKKDDQSWETITHTLNVDSIILNVYNTGTAILSFHLRNYESGKPRKILEINQFGRRLYPPSYILYKDQDWILEGTKDNTFDKYQPDQYRYHELPKKIAIYSGDDIKKAGSWKSIEDFNKYQDKEQLKHGPFNIPTFIEDLFPLQFIGCHEKQMAKDIFMYIRPVLDDRMFVVSWAGNNGLSRKLKSFSHFPRSYKYPSNDWWYEYVFVDHNGPSCQNKIERESQLSASTYARWIDYGTLFGITKYSFAMVTKQINDGNAFLLGHLQTMYYKMVELCLMHRASLLHFSDEITHVVAQDEKTQLAAIQSLYKRYVLFINKIYFREVTAQEQGIELYNMIQQQMNLPQEVKALDHEMQELHQLARSIQDKKNNDLLLIIAIISAFFLPLSLMVGIFGMTSYPSSEVNEPISGVLYYPFWQTLGIAIGAPSLISIVLITLHALYKRLVDRNVVRKYTLSKWRTWLLLISILALGVSLFLFFIHRFF